MKILMTGGDGFLGKHVKSECEYHEHIFASWDMKRGHDILERDAFMIECMSYKPDVIIHAAAVADLYQSDENPDKNFSINVQGTYYVSRICSILNIPLIYISTCCAYGNQPEAEERTRPVPTETYAWSKLAGEDALGCAGKLSALILRLGTFYGPGMRFALFNYSVINKIMLGEEIFVHGDGEQTRQYIHVQDVAQGVVKAAQKLFDAPKAFSNAPYLALNVVGDQPISANQTIHAVVSITDKKTRVKYVPQREGQILNQNIQSLYTQQFLNWKPKISYEEGMRECVKWYQSEVANESRFN